MAVFASTRASADGTATADGVDAERRERCATRLAIALTGESASPELFAAADPQSKVDELLADARFASRFATFVNARFNDEPGETAEEDAPFYVAREVIRKGKPWKDLFLGPYQVVRTDDGVVVQEDEQGLGYFRSNPWLLRYAGNESEGLKIATAYRMMQNTVGLDLTAVTNEPDADISANGRQSSACAGCHFTQWYALDSIASVLTRRVDRPNGTVTFSPPTGGPQKLLDGVTVSDDKELVTALVNSEAFDVRTCRMAFRFLFGRDENACEGQLFDRCVDAFRSSGTIAAAVATYAKDPLFCE